MLAAPAANIPKLKIQINKKYKNDQLHNFQDGVNGNIFASGEELATLLLDLLRYHIDERLHKLEAYKKNIRGMTRWKENWEECARSLIVGDSP